MTETVAAAAEAVARQLELTIGVHTAGGHGRRADRAAGVAVAESVLRRAGAPDANLHGHEPDGRPRWPAGWTGSISHGAGVVVAAVAAVDRWAAIGIDVEDAGALSVDDAAFVLDDEERAGVVDAFDATLRWSAKESAFKAWSTAIGGLAEVDPREVHVEVERPTGALTATARGRLGERLGERPLHGIAVTAGGMVLTVVVLTVLVGGGITAAG